MLTAIVIIGSGS